MHPRVRQRREDLGRSPIDAPGNEAVTDLLRVMHVVQAKFAKINAVLPDERIKPLMLRLEAARKIIERSSRSDLTAIELLPSVNDTILQLSAVLREIRDEVRAGVFPPSGSSSSVHGSRGAR